METKFTPGPWRLNFGVDEGKPFPEDWKQVSISSKSEYGPVIVTIDFENWDVTKEQGQANARLIAAAPDLYEACKEFVRKVDCGEARSVRSYKQMKSAIAKAEGRIDL